MCRMGFFHCWLAKLLIFRCYSSPLTYVSSFKQRTWFLRVLFKPWGYTAFFPSLLLESFCFLFSSPFVSSVQIVLSCSLPLLNPNPVPGYQPKVPQPSGLCLVLVLPVPVSSKKDGRGSAGKWKYCSGMSVGEHISVGMLHVLFFKYLSQISSCQTVLQQLVKHLQQDLWKVIQISNTSLTSKLKCVGWHVPPN